VAPDLRTKLLPFTIANAREKRFYKEHWAGHDVDAVTDVASLPAIPTLSKQQYRSGFMLDFDDPGDSHFVSHSTGTTGELTWRHRSLTEAATVDHLFSAARPAPEPGEAPRAGIILETAFHGMGFPIPGGQLTLPAATHGDTELGHAVEMLQMTYRVHGHRVRPTVIMGSAADLALLGQALHDHGVDTDALAIEAVHSGGFADVGMRRFIESAFGAPETGRFSMSEVLGGASYDSGLDAYRLDPYVIGEVVDEAGNALPPGGVGELTLTELFPLVQMQPMIRYRTGDIVKRVASEDELTFAFSWWGRRDDSVAVRSGDDLRWRFGFRHVADLLSEEPSVARRPVRPGLTIVTTTEVGDLYVVLEPHAGGEPGRVPGDGEPGGGEPGDGEPGGVPGGFDLTVRLRHAPELHPEALTAITARLESGLREIAGDGDPLNMTLRFENGSAAGPQ
jgi:hypothetical protein